MSIVSLKYPRVLNTNLLFSGALLLALTACGDSGGADDEGDGDKGSEASSAKGDEGQGDGKDVVTIGDSWMNLDNTNGIQQSLEKTSGRDYRNYAVPGTKLLDEVIPKQYEAAKMEGPIKTVIMTGGGNDIIQDKLIQCSDGSFGDECKAQIDRVAERLVKLWAEMAADGVRDVILVGYTKKANILGLFPVSKSAVYSEEKIPPLCDSVPKPLRCHAIDTDKEVPNLALRSDGIHPDDASYDALSKVIWSLMQADGIRR